jgi:hypothetical protein
MTHPVVLKTSQLILAGDVKGAETALANIADTEGDGALVEILDDIAPKDLLAIMRGFDGSGSRWSIWWSCPSSLPGLSFSKCAIATRPMPRCTA